MMTKQRRCSFLTLSWMLMAVMAPAACSTSSPTSTPPDYVQNGDDLIGFSEAGTGNTTLLLIHGWSGDQSYWREQIVPLSSTYRVVAIDLAGHGASTAKRNDWSIPAFGSDVSAVARRYCDQPVILIGQSLGGLVAVEAANQIGDCVTAVIGVDTLKDLDSVALPLPLVQMIGSLKPDNFNETVDKLVRAAFFIDVSPPEVVDWIASDTSEADHSVATNSIIAVNAFDQFAAVERLARPLVLINSDNTPTDTVSLQAANDEVRLVEISRAGHFAMLEAPERFNDLLLSVLEDLDQ